MRLTVVAPVVAPAFVHPVDPCVVAPPSVLGAWVGSKPPLLLVEDTPLALEVVLAPLVVELAEPVDVAVVAVVAPPPPLVLVAVLVLVDVAIEPPEPPEPPPLELATDPPDDATELPVPLDTVPGSVWPAPLE